ncbi:helix-turn-helix transcriptional regulator [Vibrio cholerae]|uniref:helix-turn-helix transcriptional regulator n=1 Tax=Vibrio cholerae TaxID=666 RepID=UPI00129B686F|nr:helix-turn-helix transcriptional regulator [Vibrio cholerae]MRI14543.1 XRE family transcriptional regulator [Vibrio cholerae]
MIKDVLRESRSRCGFTQEEIAKRVKVAKQTYLKWENGDTEPKASQIKLLAENLGITADEICNGYLYGRYTLDDFIIEQHISQAPTDGITLRTWQHIKDHESFINSLKYQQLNHDEMDEMHASEVLYPRTKKR